MRSGVPGSSGDDRRAHRPARSSIASAVRLAAILGVFLGLPVIASHRALGADNAGVYEFLSGNSSEGRSARPREARGGFWERGLTPTYGSSQNVIHVQGRPSLRKASRRREGGTAHAALANPANMTEGSAFAPVSRGKVCVRLCDGFQYPVETLGASDEATEKLCQARCPDTAVRMFSVRDSDDLNSAVDRDKRAYRELLTAFAYQRERPAACSCRKPSEFGKNLNPLDDPTLRKGDVIVTPTGAKVFKGAPASSHQPGEFVDAARAGGFSAAQKTALGLALAPRAGPSGRRGKASDPEDAPSAASPAAAAPASASAEAAVASDAPRVILASPFVDPNAFGRPVENSAAGDTHVAPAEPARTAADVIGPRKVGAAAGLTPGPGIASSAAPLAR